MKANRIQNNQINKSNKFRMKLKKINEIFIL